jgi:competence ComEA-like helix-hairpin-helix protein
LKEVFAAVPPELIQGASKLSDEMLEVATMRDLFRPRADATPAAPPVAAVPAPAPVPPPPVVAAPVPAPTPVAPPPAPAIVPSAPPVPPAPVIPAEVVPPAPVVTPVPVPAEIAPAAAAAAPAYGFQRTGEKKRKVLKLPPDAWDGVERGRDASVEAVDVNTADLQKLLEIPDVGETRARRIIEYREKNGPFAGIYDLCDVPGIGRRLFMQITGLNPAPTLRRNRHDVLNEMIGQPAGVRLPLSGMIEGVQKALQATGLVLSNREGIVLAISGMDGDVADRQAAIVPAVFRRMRRYLPRLTDSNFPGICIPGDKSVLLLMASKDYFMIVQFDAAAGWDARCGTALQMLGELAWLMGPRAVVKESV